MTTSTILTIIGLCLTLFFSGFALYFSVKGNKRTDSKDIKEETETRAKETAERIKDNAVINLKLDNIASSMEEIRKDLSAMRESIQRHGDRLIIAEESISSLKHRMDAVEKKLDEHEE